MSLKLHHLQDTGDLRCWRAAERQSRWTNEPVLNLYCTFHTGRLSRPSVHLYVNPCVTSNSFHLISLWTIFLEREMGNFNSYQWTETRPSHFTSSRCPRPGLKPTYKGEKLKMAFHRSCVISLNWVCLSRSKPCLIILCNLILLNSSF